MSDKIDNKINQVWINLKILASIKEYDKLSNVESQLEIDQAGMSQGMRRWWEGRSRADTLRFLKDEVFQEAFEIIDKTLADELEERNHNGYFRESNHNILQKFLLELKNAIVGLQNLRITYTGDISFRSHIDMLIEEIEFRLEKIKDALKIKLEKPLPLRNGKVRAGLNSAE